MDIDVVHLVAVSAEIVATQVSWRFSQRAAAPSMPNDARGSAVAETGFRLVARIDGDPTRCATIGAALAHAERHPHSAGTDACRS